MTICALDLADLRCDSALAKLLSDKTTERLDMLEELCKTTGVHWLLIGLLSRINTGQVDGDIRRRVLQLGIDEAVEEIKPTKETQIRATMHLLDLTQHILCYASDPPQELLHKIKAHHPRNVLSVMADPNYPAIATEVYGIYVKSKSQPQETASATAQQEIKQMIDRLEIMYLPLVAGTLVQISEYLVEIPKQPPWSIRNIPNRQVITQTAVAAIFRRLQHTGYLTNNDANFVAAVGTLLRMTTPRM